VGTAVAWFFLLTENFDDTWHFLRELIFIEVATEEGFAPQGPRIQFQNSLAKSLLSSRCRGITAARFAHRRRRCHTLDAGVKHCRSDLKYVPSLGSCF
jgi:hypothetical protein